MTLRLEEIGKFVLLEPGKGIALPGERRKVRLELNTQFPCQIMFDYGDEDQPRFLATVEGRETVEFIAEGPVRLYLDSEGQVWWWTSEIERSSVVSDAPTYTTVAERQARNPDLERIARVMSENARRREAALLEELRALRGTVNSLQSEVQNAKPTKRNKGAGAGAAGAAVGEPAASAGALETPQDGDGGGGNADAN